MRVYLNKSPRSVAIVSDGFALLLREMHGQASKDSKPKCVIEFVPEQLVPLHKYVELKGLGGSEIHAVLGIVCMKGLVFVGFVTGRSEVGSVRINERIYKITATTFVCLNSDSYDYALFDGRIRTHEDFPEIPVHSIIRLLATGTFYYSPCFDLVSRFQERGVRSARSVSSFNLVDDYDGRFAWNRSMIGQLQLFRNRLSKDERRVFNAGQFVVSIIRGFAQTVTVNENEGLLTIISKQSCLKGSPMFGPYCADDDGNVPNFVETEIILTNKYYCFALVQLSGNVPLVWKLESQLMSTKIEFPRSEEASNVAFSKHFETLILEHGAVHVIDALSRSGDQPELSRRYAKMVQQSPFWGSHLSYTKADIPSSLIFKSSYHYLAPLMQQISDHLKTYEAFCFDIETRTYIGRQSGVLLVNTLASTERANTIMAAVSAEVLDYFFKFLNFTPGPEFWAKHQFLWTENGTCLERMVEGYTSSKTKTKSGGFVGKVAEKSKKYVSSTSSVTFSKQNQFDKLLGQRDSQVEVALYDPIHDYVVAELQKRADEFTMTKELSLWTGTFNVNAIKYDGDITSWFFPAPEKYPEYDIIAVGLEEVVELSPGKMLNIDASTKIFWEKKIKETLNWFKEGVGYTLLKSEQLGGILSLVFVQEKNFEYISNVETSFKKTGFRGISANKGGIAIAFDYSSSIRLCFIASHLAAGHHNVDERHQNYKAIANGLRFRHNKSIRDFDCVFWVGDFNFRIDLPNEQVRTHLDEVRFTPLFEYDQLNKQMATGESFPYFNEMAINFPPTYKFDRGTDTYDTSDKQRVPAWTDRILSLARSKNVVLRQLEYGCAQEIKFSDHKPVYGVFHAKLDIADQKIMSEIEKQLYETRKVELVGVNSLVLAQNINESTFLLTHGLPAPSGKTTGAKWWIPGGTSGKIKVSFPEVDSGRYVINPKLPANPFTKTTEEEFVKKPVESIGPHSE
ncbi:hypothetical protein KL942_003277 [Ogataea angusta]|uniref:phosphoinositide 5-phosphatase n=1 Tax=Pichia angusta TaxID=870730 RepID=A0ABQ7RW31_PICAN|nr:hypothetical protein KL943_003741 [Ogataea angusta]KAG7839666.1 hypothetical protein KL942_003277 [Ogataea angusta]KAG7849299.1 hypothetical protein KL940_002981 [Ogataea angusta]KAG7858237.1 hypothetical protein KL919_003495 [Ogataea angusta]